MNLNTLLKWLIILSPLIFIACGDTTVETKPPPPSNLSSGRIYNSNDCKAHFISNSNTSECFYPLPLMKNGETFTSNYKDTVNIQSKGITVGKGQWRCQNGHWYQIYPPVCLTCLPGHSLKHCTTQLENLIKKTMIP